MSYKAPSGTRDVLAPESGRWAHLVATFAQPAARAGYGLVLSPMFEELAVFQRVGESTDVVRKEMYDFQDKGGRHLALRPEGTASVVRAFVEHRPATPWKAWYAAPSFRYERPQAGRYRQHHQLGIEALGSDDPDLDVEVIALLDGFYDDIGLRRRSLLLTSLGDAATRPAYLAALRAHLEAAVGDLSEQSRLTMAINPLRVLDSKRPEDAEVVAGAPKLVDHLSDEAGAHHERVLSGLAALGVEVTPAPRLVRGFDYYTRTTFEFVSDALESAQNAVGGGGRYDGLVEQMGGPPTPGIGFGTGLERMMLALAAEDVEVPGGGGVDVFVVDTSDGRAALAITHELRAAGISADRAFDGRSMRSQMKAADRSGARLAVIVGPEEAAAGSVGLREMRAGGDQQVVDRSQMIEHVRNLLA